MVGSNKDVGVPDDLCVKIGTKDEALWTELKENTEIQIEALEKSLIVNREILKMAKQKIKEEQKKRKSK